MRAKVVKKVCLFAVMLAVLVSTVAFSASAFSFDVPSPYTHCDVLFNLTVFSNDLENLTVLATYTDYEFYYTGNVGEVYSTGNSLIVRTNTVSGTRRIEWYDPDLNIVKAYFTSSSNRLFVYNERGGSFYSSAFMYLYYNHVTIENPIYLDFVLNIDSIYEDGFNAGASSDYQDGYNAGYQEGLESGAEVNYNQGFQAGYNEAVNELRETGTKGLFDFCQLKAYYTYQNSTYIISNVPFSVSETGVASFAESYSYIANYLTEQGIAFDDSFVLNGLSFSLVDSGTRLRFLFTDQYYIGGNIPPNVQYMSIGYDYDPDAPDETINPLSRRTVDGVNGWFGFNPNDYQIYVYSFNFWSVSLGDLPSMTLTSNINIFGSQYTLGYQAGVEEGLAGGGNALVNEAVRVARLEGERAGYDRGYADAFQLVEEGGFREMITAVIDVPFNAFRSLLNFEVLGINLMAFVTSLFTLAIVIIVIKKVI